MNIIDKLDYMGKILDRCYIEANTLSKKKILERDLFTYRWFYEDFMGLSFRYDWKVFDSSLKKNYCFTEVDKYLDISKMVIDCFRDKGDYLYRYFYMDSMKIDKKKGIEVIEDFFLMMGREVYDIYKRVSGNILYTPLYGNRAMLVSFDKLKEDFIVINDKGYFNTDVIMSIVHEIGHLFEIETYRNSIGNLYRDRSIYTPYFEVSSLFFEYAFINYLKDNDIFGYTSDYLINSYLKHLFIHSYYSNILYRGIKGDNCLLDRVNFYPDLYLDQDSYKSNSSYMIGYVMAIYMYDRFKGYDKGFMKDLRECFLKYPYFPLMDTFKEVGGGYDDIMKGDIFKRIR